MSMSKYYVLTESSALRLGIIDADGAELEHAATLGAIATAAESGHDSYASAVAAAKSTGGERWILDESGDSEYVVAA